MASEEIPNGYGQWTAIWRLDGAPRELAVTCGFYNENNDPPATTGAAVYNAGQSGADALFDPSVMPGGLTLHRFYILQKRAGGLESAVISANVDGTGSWVGAPINTAVVVAKQSVLAGRQYRGRFEWPSAYVDRELVDDAAVIDGGEVGALQLKFNTFFAALATNNVPPMLLHAEPKSGLPAPTPTAINNFDVRNQLGSARRRLKRIAA